MSQCEHTGEVLKHADGSIRCLDCEKMIKPNYKTQVAALRSQLATVTAEREAYKRIIDDVRAGNYDNANDSLAARKFIYKELEALKGGKG